MALLFMGDPAMGADVSDMDLVVLIDDPDAGLDPSLFVSMIGDLLERVSGSQSVTRAIVADFLKETNFDVKPLPKARIPIIKLNLAASPGLPFGECDAREGEGRLFALRSAAS